MFDFNRHKLAGQPEQQARWKRCVQATDTALGEALGQVYVGQEFPPASKAATLQMVHDIENAMDQDIDTLDWMSAETKVRAKAKLLARLFQADRETRRRLRQRGAGRDL